MALKVFEDLPSTNTPINATNLNNNFNELNNKMPENITTGGSGVKAGFKVDNKDVYVKRINFGNLPNNSSKSVATGIDLSNYSILKIDGYCKSNSNNIGFPIPFTNPSSINLAIMVNMADNGDIVINTGYNRSDYTAWFDIYYF